MTTLLKKITTGVLIAGLFASSVFATTHAGYADFASFHSDSGKTFVEVDINKSLLKLASVFTQKEDPEISALIASLERVRVNVIEADGDDHEAAIAQVEALRSDLDDKGWNRIVTVREATGDDVAVFVQQGPDDAILGVVVTVLGSSGEAVMVNVVGEVQLEQLARLGERLNIDPLRELDLSPAKS
ncbi:MAG: hypothetical protein SynsKO_39740 [Synoicihabitans sp.]